MTLGSLAVRGCQAPLLFALLSFVLFGCGDSTEATGGSGGDPGSAELCRPQWAHYTGDCEPAGMYYWDGLECRNRTGCDCMGSDCDEGWPSEQECLDAHESCDSKGCGGWAPTRSEPCASDEYCAYQPDRTCGWADAPASCAKIPSRCPDISDPVCGCDGQSYDNPCLAAQAGTGILGWGPCNWER